jgi:uncharacterized membrane protein YccC
LQGFALWARAPEGRATRAESSRDLLLLSAAAALGAASFIFLAPLLHPLGHAGPELTLVTGAFLVGYLRRFGLTESAWAITACTDAISGTASATIDRVKRRILGTAIGVPLGLACLPLATAAPLVVWAAAAPAMVIYAMALPERYDVACGAFAFTLIVTLAVSGDHSIPLLASRAWETLLGGVLGLVISTLLLPLRTSKL